MQKSAASLISAKYFQYELYHFQHLVVELAVVLVVSGEVERELAEKLIWLVCMITSKSMQCFKI